MADSKTTLAQAWLLVSRMERLSADSVWAHRASGVRGALLRSIAETENSPSNSLEKNICQLQIVMDAGYRMLENAARELF